MNPRSRDGAGEGRPCLAQVNVSRPRAALDSPLMGGFLAAIEPVNRLAEASPGFVWRLRSGESHARCSSARTGSRSW